MTAPDPASQPRRLTARDLPQPLLELYDFYAHGRISKREFLAGAAKFSALGLSAPALLAVMSPDYALAQQVAADDPAIATGRITYDSPDGHGAIAAYRVVPADAADDLPAVLVIHENRGLNPYVEDVARRLGKAGFLALAPDGLTPLGGYPGTDDEGRELQRRLDPVRLMNDFFAGFQYLLTAPGSTGRVGAVGFCYGGGVVNALAVTQPQMAAGVSFYGRQPDPASVPAIQAALLIQLAELDSRINEGWPAYQAALDAAGITYAAHIYPGVNHGFHNDTTPRFDPEAAALAEERTLAFFAEHLRG